MPEFFSVVLSTLYPYGDMVPGILLIVVEISSVL